MTWAQRWNRFWFEADYSAWTLAAVRIALCALLLSDITSTGMVAKFTGDVPGRYFANGFYASYAPWLSPPPYPVFVWVSRVLVVCAVLGLVGLWTRASLLLAVGLFSYLFALNRFFYLNHYYFLMLAVLCTAFMPCAERLSVDAWRARRPAPDTVRSWAARLLQVQLSIVYLSSAASKTTAAWCSGELLQLFHDVGRIKLPGVMSLAASVPLAWQACGALAVEYALAFALWPRRTRVPALILGVGFHLYMNATMSIGSFSWQVLAIYLLFLDPLIRRRR